MKNIHKSVLTSAFILGTALALPTTAHAVIGGVMVPRIVEILVTSESNPGGSGLSYGGCMAGLSVPVNTAAPAPDCPYNWVSFSCDGTYASKEVAQLMLDQAQLALATKSPIFIAVDDSKKHNGYCTVIRMDIMSN